MQNRSPKSSLISAVEFGVSHGFIEVTPDEEEDPRIVANKLVTTMIYESRRHGWEARQCRELRYHIAGLNPDVFSLMTEKGYIEYIEAEERDLGTYFGSYLSDDSDSDEENKYQRNRNKKKKLLVGQATTFRNRGELKNIIAQRKSKLHEKGDLRVDGNVGSDLFDLKKRQAIYHEPGPVKEKAEKDLAHLNGLIESGKTLVEALAIINAEKRREPFTNFYIAEYRGITYQTSLWNKSSRVAHRRDQDEIGKRQYSASVYKAAGFSIFRDYPNVAHQTKENPQLLDGPAELLREILLTFREPNVLSYDKYTYSNLAYLLQNIYSQDYHGFLGLIRRDERLSTLLLNGDIPFVSMGDVPYHALKYALGMKPYPGYERMRLQPRWRKDGRAERPHTGVVYLSLHPISDFDNDGPLSLVALSADAEIKLEKELIIIAERETTFPSYLPENRVVQKNTAKYPSFSKPYRPSMLIRYGLKEDEYYRFRDALQAAPPHTPEHKKIKQLLGEAICSYREACLIECARIHAKKKGGVLIYRDIGGKFSLELPRDSVNRYSGKAKDVEDKQKTRMLAIQSVRALHALRGLSLEDVKDTKAIHSILRTVERDGVGDIPEITNTTDITLEGNDTMSLPLILMLNAIKHRRYLALEHFLKIPVFIKAINERFNTAILENGTLLHFAAFSDDVTALKLLLSVPGCDLYAGAEEPMDSHPEYTCSWDLHPEAPYYENISPIAYAIINWSNNAAEILINHPGHNNAILSQCVLNKDLLEDMAWPYEDGGRVGVIGYTVRDREGVPITRVVDNTLLHVAVYAKNKRVIPSLIATNEISFFKKNSLGKSAADVAVLSADKEMFDLLRSESLAHVDRFYREIKEENEASHRSNYQFSL